jgi:hypothetical protein
MPVGAEASIVGAIARSCPVGMMNILETLEFTPFLSAIKSPSAWNRFRSWWSKGTNELRTTPASDPAAYSPCNPGERLDAYKRLLEEARSIYVFRNGTAVYSAETMSQADALQIMSAYGPVRPGTPSADFYVASIESPVSGIAVRYAHPQIVSFEEFPPTSPKLGAGSLIRLSREMDSHDLHVVAHYTKEQ